MECQGQEKRGNGTWSGVNPFDRVWHNLGESSSLIETETDSVCAQKEHDFHERSSSFT
jgi:hypothetical protein